MMMKKDARALLPRVGERMRKAPTIVHLRGLVQTAEPQDCTVVEVNPAGLWYRVEFDNGGTECYKVPEEKGGGQA